MNECDFCQNTGEHACPDVAQIVIIPCSKKNCVYGKLKRFEYGIKEILNETWILSAADRDRWQNKLKELIK